MDALSICNNLYLCMPGPYKDQKRVSDAPELSYIWLETKMWVLETELRSSARASNVLTTESLCWTLCYDCSLDT